MITDNLPQDLPAEKAVLGVLLFDRDAIIKVAPILNPADFYDYRHGLIYGAVLDCYARRVPPDFVTVSSALGDRLEEVGGMNYLMGLHDEPPVWVHVEHYARTVYEKATRRRLLSAGGDIAGYAFDTSLTVEQIQSEATHKLMAVFDGTGEKPYATLEELGGEFLERWDWMAENPNAPTGIASGFHDLDEMTGGFQPGQLIVMAARTGMGKTSIALNIARNVAKAPSRVTVFSLEMTRQELFTRLLSTEARVDSQKLRILNHITEQESGKVADALGRLPRLPIYIDDKTPLTIEQIRSRAHRIKAERGMDFLVVDYLQLVRVANARTMSKEQQVSEVARGLKELAKELHVPLLACCQMNRKIEERQGNEPRLSDLRDSGEIEHAADIVIFVHRPGMYEGAVGDISVSELRVEKHRSGPLGIVALKFDPATTEFRPYAPFKVVS